KARAVRGVADDARDFVGAGFEAVLTGLPVKDEERERELESEGPTDRPPVDRPPVFRERQCRAEDDGHSHQTDPRHASSLSFPKRSATPRRCELKSRVTRVELTSSPAKTPPDHPLVKGSADDRCPNGGHYRVREARPQGTAERDGERGLSQDEQTVTRRGQTDIRRGHSDSEWECEKNDGRQHGQNDADDALNPETKPERAAEGIGDVLGKAVDDVSEASIHSHRNVPLSAYDSRPKPRALHAESKMNVVDHRVPDRRVAARLLIG